MSSSKTSAQQAFAASGGVQIPIAPADDPFGALDSLMSVIEALCPIWPARGPLLIAREMLL
jgi:hypothetical protein